MKNALCVLFVSLAVACGGKNSGTEMPTCTATGIACADDTECCTGNCDDMALVCARIPGTCVAAEGGCTQGPDCCSFACVDFKCQGDQCTSDGESCSDDGECCGGLCSDGLCAPLNPTCKTSGNTCGANAECCSGSCLDGVCNNSPSYCVQVGDTCTTDAECCGGMCAIAAGATLGTCEVVPSNGATGCATAGELCDAGADWNGEPLPICGGECCSRACFPYGPSGALICQPPSGCKPTGELCMEDSDCCGGPGQPDNDPSNVMCRKEAGNPVGRCDNGNSCSPAGAICRLMNDSCNANTNCCAGNSVQEPTCQQDNLGIPRCLTAEIDCTDPGSHTGQPCATSADCCGLPCTPDANGTLVCNGACIQQGGACTTGADCCSGLPCENGVCGPPGECAEYGQTCQEAADCCNGLPCNDNKCQQIIL